MSPTTTRLKSTKVKKGRKETEKEDSNEKAPEETEDKETTKERTKIKRGKKRIEPTTSPESPPQEEEKETRVRFDKTLHGGSPYGDTRSPPSSDSPSSGSSSSDDNSESSGSRRRSRRKKKRRKKIKFARNPGMANRSRLLNFTKSSTMKYYEKATKVLLPELFDCESDRLYAFLKALKRRAKESGWTEEDGILSVPYDIDYPDEDQVNLVTDYGVISIHQVRDHEEMYIDSETRKAQDNDILFNCLMESISESARNKIVIWEEDYTVRGEYSGPLLLKVIIRESHLDTNATTSAVQTQLTKLHEYLPTIGSDITKFNTHVKLLLGTLDARGVRPGSDLILHLFKAYSAAECKKFVKYIERKQDENDDRRKSMSPYRLMQKADNRFRLLKSRGEWTATDETEDNILALQVRMNKMEKSHKTLQSTANRQRDRSDNSGRGRGGRSGRAGRGRGGRGGRGSDRNRPSWFNKEPNKEDLHKPKTWNGVEWYYCSPKTGGKCDGKHRRHKPSECKGPGYVPKRETGSKRDNRGHNKMRQAYQAVHEGQNDTDYSSDRSN